MKPTNSSLSDDNVKQLKNGKLTASLYQDINLAVIQIWRRQEFLEILEQNVPSESIDLEFTKCEARTL